MGSALRPLIASLLVVAGAACEYLDFPVKVPITPVNAAFTLANSAWFEEEETLFLFYRVSAEQGLGPLSQLEVSWRTDAAEQPWTNLATLPDVHRHLPVDCGANGRCGSKSLHLPLPPRDLRLRLRYHRDGEMALEAPLIFTPVARGPAHTHRSLLVYGVFDQSNTHVQWRARHQFPSLRNQEAEELGLRRRYLISEAGEGALTAPWSENPYGYGLAPTCPPQFTPLGWPALETEERAIFNPIDLPALAFASPQLCARSTVFDARGAFEAATMARKNPEVAPAFPLLHSPIQTEAAVPFLLRMCRRAISEPHLSMQRQRLLLAGAPEICVDDWAQPGFAEQLASKFAAQLDARRLEGQDMVLLFALHHDESTGGLARAVESALEKLLPLEREKSSPRVSGAFVFDSLSYTVASPQLRPLVLWCPANAPGDDLDQIPAASERSCPLLPDNPDLQLGPFQFNQLPILPTRPQYSRFLEKYSEAQAGRTRALTFKAPVRTPLSENVPLGEYGVATFFNNEVLTASPTDRFSFCAPPDGSAQAVVFRVPGVQAVLPLSALPQVHERAPQPRYGLGLAWDFPYLLRLEYETAVAGAVTVAAFTVPFGIKAPTQEASYGTQLWEKGDFPLGEVITRCTRFCDHPTFDTDGVYKLQLPFWPSYRDRCYRPAYPALGDGGFPRDP